MIYYNDNGTWTTPSSITVQDENNNSALALIRPIDYLTQYDVTTVNSYSNWIFVDYSNEQKCFMMLINESSGLSDRIETILYSSSDGIEWNEIYRQQNEISFQIRYNNAIHKWVRFAYTVDELNTIVTSINFLASENGVSWQPTCNLQLQTGLTLNELYLFNWFVQYPSNNNYIFSASNYGVLKSADGGTTFQYYNYIEFSRYDQIFPLNIVPIPENLSNNFPQEINIVIIVGKVFNEAPDNSREYENYLYGFGIENSDALIQISGVSGEGTYWKCFEYSPKLNMYVATNEYNYQPSFVPTISYSYNLTDWYITPLNCDAWCNVFWLSHLSLFLAIGNQQGQWINYSSNSTPLAFSFDGIHWHPLVTNIQLPQFADFDSLAYNDDLGYFVIATKLGEEATYIAKSKPIGNSKQILSSCVNNAYSVSSNMFATYAESIDSQFIDSDVKFYLDNYKITQQNVNAYVKSFAYSEQLLLFAAIKNSGENNKVIAYISHDGTNWLTIDTGITLYLQDWNDLQWVDKYNAFVTVGNGNANGNSTPYYSYSLISYDGYTWQLSQIPGDANTNNVQTFSQLKYDNEYIVSFNYGRNLYSKGRISQYGKAIEWSNPQNILSISNHKKFYRSTINCDVNGNNYVCVLNDEQVVDDVGGYDIEIYRIDNNDNNGIARLICTLTQASPCWGIEYKQQYNCLIVAAYSGIYKIDVDDNNVTVKQITNDNSIRYSPLDISGTPYIYVPCAISVNNLNSTFSYLINCETEEAITFDNSNHSWAHSIRLCYSNYNGIIVGSNQNCYFSRTYKLESKYKQPKIYILFNCGEHGYINKVYQRFKIINNNSIIDDLPSVVTIDNGYSFDGWYYNNEKIDKNYRLESNKASIIVIHAQYNINQ